MDFSNISKETEPQVTRDLDIDHYDFEMFKNHLNRPKRHSGIGKIPINKSRPNLKKLLAQSKFSNNKADF